MTQFLFRKYIIHGTINQWHLSIHHSVDKPRQKSLHELEHFDWAFYRASYSVREHVKSSEDRVNVAAVFHIGVIRGLTCLQRRWEPEWDVLHDSDWGRILCHRSHGVGAVIKFDPEPGFYLRAQPCPPSSGCQRIFADVVIVMSTYFWWRRRHVSLCHRRCDVEWVCTWSKMDSMPGRLALLRTSSFDT